MHRITVILLHFSRDSAKMTEYLPIGNNRRANCKQEFDQFSDQKWSWTKFAQCSSEYREISINIIPHAT